MLGDPDLADRQHGALERTVAAAVVVLVAARVDVTSGITVGFITAVGLSPVWLRHTVRFQWVRLVVGVLVVAVVSGWWLSMYSAGNHSVSQRQMIETAVVVVSIITGVGVLLWARTMWHAWQVALLFGVGSLAAISTGGSFSVNPWRFGFSLPVILIVLSVAAGSRRRWLELVSCAALCLVTALSGGRSRTGILVLVGLLLMWQLWRPPSRSGASVIRLLLIVSAAGFAILQFGQALVLEGYLGEAAEARTEMQIAQSGSILMGGRPEMAATAALFSEYPGGFGFGVSPNHAEIIVAKAGLRGINYDPDNGYVETYMFGSVFELHSMIGDMWAWMGLAGLAAAITLLVVVLAGLARRVINRNAAGVALFAAVSTVWNMCFSPLNSSVPLLVLALALLPYKAFPRARSGHGRTATLNCETVPVGGRVRESGGVTVG